MINFGKIFLSVIITTLAFVHYNLSTNYNHKSTILIASWIAFVFIAISLFKSDSSKSNSSIEIENKLLKDELNEYKAMFKLSEKRNAELNNSIDYLRSKVKSVEDSFRTRDALYLTDREILGVSEICKRRDIKDNYIKLCNIYHPDKCASDVMMKRINKAYQRIKTG